MISQQIIGKDVKKHEKTGRVPATSQIPSPNRISVAA